MPTKKTSSSTSTSTSTSTSKSSTLFNFDKQFIQYAEYHNEPVNQIIHMIFVPTILFTALVWLSNISLSSIPLSTPVSIPLPLESLGLGLKNMIYSFKEINITVATLYSTSYAIYYILLSPTLGTILAPLVVAMSFAANTFRTSGITGEVR